MTAVQKEVVVGIGWLVLILLWAFGYMCLGGWVCQYCLGQFGVAASYWNCVLAFFLVISILSRRS